MKLRPSIFRIAAERIDGHLATYACEAIIEADNLVWNGAADIPERQFFDQLYQADSTTYFGVERNAYFGHWGDKWTQNDVIDHADIRVLALLFAELFAEDVNAQQPRWNGEKCHAVLGSVVIGKAVRPTWWCADLAGERRACVRVTYKGDMFYLDNDDGSGYRKVFEQGGGPNSSHSDIPVDQHDTFIESL